MMNSYNRFIIGLCLILQLPTYTSYGQSKIKKYAEKRQKLKKEAIENNKPWFSPLVGPGYTVDTGFLVAGGFLYSFKGSKTDSISQRSSLPGTIYYSSKGDVGIKANLTSFWKEDHLRIGANFIYNTKDNNYFGKGVDEIDNTYESDTTTLYHEAIIGLYSQYGIKLLKNIYLGPTWDISYTKNTNINPVMLDDPYYQEFGNQYFLNGLGIRGVYDSRDIPVNAWKGYYLLVEYQNYFQGIGSDFNFEKITIDTRYYKTFIREGNVIAARLNLISTKGAVPYTELVDFAGSNDIRGYVKGKYRDNAGVISVLEWRYTFMRHKQKLSKSGVVAWAGAGSIGPEVIDLSEWYPNFGIGYRYALQPRMNVRIDFGWGTDTYGLYFNFNEAF